MKHLLKLGDLSREEILSILNLADQLKFERNNGIQKEYLKGKKLGMIFQKASTRTRVSFEAGMYELGGYALFLSSHDLQIGRGEPVQDTARVLSRYLDGIMIRTFAQQEVEDLAKYGTIPVINGLTDYCHPCQVLADLMAIREYKGTFKGLKMAFIGDGNNMANSLIVGAVKMGMNFTVACPEGYEPDAELVKWGKESGLLTITKPDGTTSTSTVSGNIVTIDYRVSATSSRSFIGSFTDMNEAIFTAEVIYSFIPGSGNEAISLDFYDDGTYEFAFATYNLTANGTWEYVGGVLKVTKDDGTVFTATITGDDISLYYNHGSGLDQTFEGSAAALGKAMVDAGITEEIYAFAPGSGNTAISLKLFENGTYEFGFATYNLKAYGTWSYKDGVFTVTKDDGTVFTATITGDDISLYYNHGSGLDQTFEGSVEELSHAIYGVGTNSGIIEGGAA